MENLAPLVGFIKKKSSLDVVSIIDWLSQVTHLPILKKQEILIRDGLPASAFEKKLSKAKNYIPNKFITGIELMAIKNITNINRLQLEKEMRAFKKTGADGIVLSWDLWHIQEESLRVLECTLLSI